GAAPERARADADVAAQRVPEARAPGVSDLVLDQRDGAEAALRGGPRLVRRHAASPVLLGLHLDVARELLVQLALAPPAPESVRAAHGRSLLRRAEHAPDRRRQALPELGLGLELAGAAPRELVDARAPVVLGRAPAGLDQPLALQPVQRRVERALADLELARE